MTRRHVLGTVAALVTLAVLGGSGAAAAVWTTSTTVTATASSAVPATTLTQAGALTTTYQYTGASSGVVYGSLTIKNTGSTPLSYGLTSEVTRINPAGAANTLADKTVLRLWTGTCSGTVPSNAIKTTLANRAPALPAAAQKLDPGKEAVVCIATSIAGVNSTDPTSTNAALQGQSVTAVFRVTGAVGTSWTATATAAAVTQSVYQLAAAGAVTCVDATGLFRRVVLSWAAPANRPARSEVTYEVVDTATGNVIKQVKSSEATASVMVEGKDLDRNGTYAFAIRAKEAVYGTTAAQSAAVAVTRTSGTFGIITATECS